MPGVPKPSWHRKSSWKPEPFVTLHNEILDLCDLLMPTTQETDGRTTALASAKEMILGILDSADCRPRVEVYGSEFTGLVTPGSDLDLVVMGRVAQDAFKMLSEGIQERAKRGEVQQVEVLDKAKVPLVKFVHTETGVAIDVTVKNNTGLISGQAMKDAMTQMKQVRPLTLVLKVYLAQKDLNKTYTGGIGSFMVQLMVIALVQKCNREAKSNGHDPPTDLGYLLYEFFEFYGNQLNYRTTGITLLGPEGGFFNKFELAWFSPYRPDLLTFQNPLEPDVDIGQKAFQVGLFRKAFRYTSQRIARGVARARYHNSESAAVGRHGILQLVIDPKNPELRDRVLPPPTWCSAVFEEKQNARRSTAYDDSFSSVTGKRKFSP
ncbi:unnamed protein product [Ectocarpus fasciculatus]